MAYALVGSLGTLATATSSVTPSYGQSPTAGNTLIAWTAGSGTTAAPSISASGWSQVTTDHGTGGGVAIWYKIAAGSDVAPVVTGSSGTPVYAQLGEFSGGASSFPVDQTGINTGTSTGITATAGAVDADAGELVLYGGNAVYSTAATKTLSVALNNGATNHDTTNNSTSSVEHMVFGWGITTGNSSADTATLTATTSKLSGDVIIVASLKLAVVVAVLPYQPLVISQAVNRSLTY